MGKKPIVTKYGISNHLLIYHCLDVAAVGHVFLEENDVYLSKMTQATGLDKKESLSLITFYLSMHDLGKFSNGVQKGDGYSIHFHAKMGFHLGSKIWDKIWQDNLLGLDQSVDESIWKDLFEPWFESVMNHHENKFQDPPQDVKEIYFNDENIAAACCFVEKSAKLLLDNNSETQKKYYEGMDVSFNSNSKLLKILTWMSDNTGSEIKRYLFTWDEIPGNDSGELREFLIQEFGISWVENGKIEKIDNSRIIRVTAETNYLSLILNNEKTQVNLKIDDGRSAEFIAKDENDNIKIYIKCFEYCSRIMPIREYWDKYAIKHAKNAIKVYGNTMIKIFEELPEFSEQDKEIDRRREEVFNRNIALSKNKYESKLIFKLKNDSSLSNPSKKITSGKATTKNNISEKNLNESLDHILFEKLRMLRKKLADKEGIPPFCIFYDLSLEDMATYFPKDVLNFKNIKGVDETNLKKYGELFIKEIIDHVKNEIEPKWNHKKAN